MVIFAFGVKYDRLYCTQVIDSSGELTKICMVIFALGVKYNRLYCTRVIDSSVCGVAN
jgi:hypothetical protein